VEGLVALLHVELVLELLVELVAAQLDVVRVELLELFYEAGVVGVLLFERPVCLVSQRSHQVSALKLVVFHLPF
jgi:hypothetical protein